MKRRRFLLGAAALTAAPCIPRLLTAQTPATPTAQTLQASLTVDRTAKLATVPADYTGLSYESAQLANPAFFAGGNWN